nr:DUF6642 family protein [Nocardia zapadnayensis]
MAKPGIWVMEGYWSRDVNDVRTVRPMTQALADSKIANYVHRHINDVDDLINGLTLLGQRKQDKYNIAYLACHGSSGVIELSGDSISLDELAGRLPKAGILESKLLHLSACSVLHDEDACKALLDTSGAQAITGFTKDVDWLESLAFELLMFNAFAGYQRLGNFVRSMNKNYGELSERLGFTVIR